MHMADFIQALDTGQKTGQKILLVFLLTFLMVGAKNAKYCSSDRHLFYMPVGDFCKECDKCGPGLELEPLEKASFEISAAHGAMGCRQCQRCKDGFFSNRRSYGSCKQCRDCEAKGKITKHKCTASTNTKCGKLKHKQQVSISRVTTMGQTTKAYYDDTSAIKNTTYKKENTAYVKTTFFLVLSCVACVIISFGIFGSFLLKKYGCNFFSCSKDRSSDGTPNQHVSFNSCREANKKDIMIDGTLEENTPCLGEVTNNNVIMVEHEYPTDKQLYFIAKRVAAKEGYRELALQLGVPENDIRIIEEEIHSNCKARSYAVLRKWTELYYESAILTEILKALTAVGRSDVVNAFYKENEHILVESSCQTSSSTLADMIDS